VTGTLPAMSVWNMESLEWNGEKKDKIRFFSSNYSTALARGGACCGTLTAVLVRTVTTCVDSQRAPVRHRCCHHPDHRGRSVNSAEAQFLSVTFITVACERIVVIRVVIVNVILHRYFRRLSPYGGHWANQNRQNQNAGATR
jgi:hypothetical protein